MDDFGGLIFLIFPLIGLICFIVWIYALIDAIKSDFRTDNEKIIWVLVIALTGIIGAVLYFLISDGRRRPDGF